MASKVDFKVVKDAAGRRVSDAVDTTKQVVVNTLDQNDDGVLNREDVTIAKEKAVDMTSKTASFMKATASEKARQLELKMLKPVFMDDIADADFELPKFIQVAEIDKKHAGSDVCQGAIGHGTESNDLKIITIYPKYIEQFGITLYPDDDSEYYYVDPSDRDRYIALDEYFAYLGTVRINELQSIAQSLGAKYFKVTYKEEKTEFATNKKTVKLGIGTKIKESAEVQHEVSEKKYTNMKIAAEMNFPGHDPIKPALHFLKGDLKVQNLINLRMDPLSPVQNHKFEIALIQSSGLKEKDALKIDAYFKKNKISGNATVTDEVRHESRRVLEYEVQF